MDVLGPVGRQQEVSFPRARLITSTSCSDILLLPSNHVGTMFAGNSNFLVNTTNTAKDMVTTKYLAHPI
jgi:hypothetical protein